MFNPNSKKMSNPSMELANMEIQAREKAKAFVADHLKRPEALEKTDQLKKRIARKKGSVEAMLKTAIQSQLDGVKNGLNQLNTALKDIREVKDNLAEIKSTYSSISDLGVKLKNIREENSRHSQLASACDNVMHIFTVPEAIKKCQELINDGKLLHAYKCISDLEKSRDDILVELHRQSVESPTDKLMVTQYFMGLEDLVDSLAKQLWLILQRTIISLRQEPTIVVTVLRIIEREERLDLVTAKRYDQVKLPGRPRNWRNIAFEVINKAVISRIEGNQMEERATSKMWLVRHLEVTRQLVIEDLKVVKSLCDSCFPPHYNMVNRYIKMYHAAISFHLNDAVVQGLEGNEIVSLLNWVNEYPSKDLMGHPDLNIDVSQFRPLLENQVIEQMYEEYLKNLACNLKEWMGNSLRSDAKDWSKDTLPDADEKGHYNTTLPVLIIQMVEQNLEVANTIGKSLIGKVLRVCIEAMKDFIKSYESELKLYKESHLANRKMPIYYTHFLIGNANNCQLFESFAKDLQKRYSIPSSLSSESSGQPRHEELPVYTAEIPNLIGQLKRLANCLCLWMMEEVFLDLESHIQNLLTKKWQLNSESVDTICITLEDYCQDFMHIKDVYYNEMINYIYLKIACEYYKAIFAKKILFRSYDERCQAVEKILKESQQLTQLFKKLSRNEKKETSEQLSLEALPPLVELLKLKDTSMISLELSGFTNTYKDIKIEMFINVLSMRGDLSRSEARQIVVDCLGEDHDSKIGRFKKTIFSTLNGKEAFFSVK